MVFAYTMDDRLAAMAAIPGDAPYIRVRIVAGDAVLCLNTGRFVSKDEIEVVADAYSTEWSSHRPDDGGSL
jgi:translation initiation factor IF-1